MAILYQSIMRPQTSDSSRVDVPGGVLLIDRRERRVISNLQEARFTMAVSVPCRAYEVHTHIYIYMYICIYIYVYIYIYIYK